MPVNNCSENGNPGYKYGARGKCYTYDVNNESSRKKAKEQAYKQGYAIDKLADASLLEKVWFYIKGLNKMKIIIITMLLFSSVTYAEFRKKNINGGYTVYNNSGISYTARPNIHNGYNYYNRRYLGMSARNQEYERFYPSHYGRNFSPWGTNNRQVRGRNNTHTKSNGSRSSSTR